MDHHCMITDNCVGIGNYKYFFHFCGWASFTLLSGITILITHFYTYNREANLGMQQWIQISCVTNPLNLWQSIVQHKIDILGIFDGYFLIWMVILLGIVAVPMVKTFLNI